MVAVTGLVAPANQRPEAVILRIERLRDEAPLHRHVAEGGLARRAREHLVQTPTGRAMVEDDVMPLADPDGIPCFPLIPQPAPQITDHHLIHIDPQPSVAQTDPVARCGLSGDRDEGISDQKVLCQPDRAGDIEHDNARPLRLHRLAQAPRPAVFQCRHMVDPPASSAFGIRPEPFRPRKRRNLPRRQQIRGVGCAHHSNSLRTGTGGHCPSCGSGNHGTNKHEVRRPSHIGPFQRSSHHAARAPAGQSTGRSISRPTPSRAR